MLAQSFVKPEVLGISEEEHSALVKVLGMLERGELVHVPGERTISPSPIGPNGFNMINPYIEEKCGTVACIGGWVAHFLNRNPFSYVNNAMDALRRLYWLTHLDNSPELYNQVTTEQAAIATRNFLTTGEPRWDEALISEADTFVLANTDCGIDTETRKSHSHARLTPRLNQV